MNPLDVLAACTEAVVECNDTHSVVIGGSNGGGYVVAAVAVLVLAAICVAVWKRRWR